MNFWLQVLSAFLGSGVATALVEIAWKGLASQRAERRQLVRDVAAWYAAAIDHLGKQDQRTLPVLGRAPELQVRISLEYPGKELPVRILGDLRSSLTSADLAESVADFSRAVEGSGQLYTILITYLRLRSRYPHRWAMRRFNRWIATLPADLQTLVRDGSSELVGHS